MDPTVYSDEVRNANGMPDAAALVRFTVRGETLATALVQDREGVERALGRFRGLARRLRLEGELP